jgi:DNA-directed RNA polymerase subunit RPC12/RpoP
MNNKKTECIYCGSRSYGSGCLFSPTKIHVHMGDPTTCIYCGSKSVGSGCLFNPYGKIHVRGPEYLNRLSEQKENIVLEDIIKDVIITSNGQ